jgi:hypothetical protein
VLHPTWLWVILFVFPVDSGYRNTFIIPKNRRGSSCALVN